MALPTLDATFASIADLPRKQMLSKWLVAELGETQAPSNVLVSGLVDSESYPNNSQYNGLYVYDVEINGRPSYVFGEFNVFWEGTYWQFGENFASLYSNSDVAYPWLAIDWMQDGAIDSTGFTITESSVSNALSNYYSLPERYLWAKIAVAVGASRTEADYINLPVHYAIVDIYKAVSGRDDLYVDTDKKAALASIACAYRGDLDHQDRYATYLSWPWRYIVASIIQAI